MERQCNYSGYGGIDGLFQDYADELYEEFCPVYWEVSALGDFSYEEMESFVDLILSLVEKTGEIGVPDRDPYVLAAMGLLQLYEPRGAFVTLVADGLRNFVERKRVRLGISMDADQILIYSMMVVADIPAECPSWKMPSYILCDDSWTLKDAEEFVNAMMKRIVNEATLKPDLGYLHLLKRIRETLVEIWADGASHAEARVARYADDDEWDVWALNDVLINSHSDTVRGIFRDLVARMKETLDLYNFCEREKL